MEYMLTTQLALKTQHTTPLVLRPSTSVPDPLLQLISLLCLPVKPVETGSWRDATKCNPAPAPPYTPYPAWWHGQPRCLAVAAHLKIQLYRKTDSCRRFIYSSTVIYNLRLVHHTAVVHGRSSQSNKRAERASA